MLIITDGMNTEGPKPGAVMPGLKQQARGKAHDAFRFISWRLTWTPKQFDPVKKLGATVVGAADEKQLNTQLEYHPPAQDPARRGGAGAEEITSKPKKEIPMFRAIKRLFIWMGLMAEKATETDAINQAVVERGIRDSKAKADKAHYANGQLAGQIALLKDQIKTPGAPARGTAKPAPGGGRRQ